MIKRIIVGESGGPTPVIDWEVAGVLAAARKYDLEVYGAINGLEGVLNADVEGNIVDLTPISPQQFIHNGPGAGLKTTRLKPKGEQYNKISANLDRRGIDGIIYIGGNDSAHQLLGLTEVNPALAAVHAIKTIDNDLPVTHHSPGWGSAALFNAVAIKSVNSDFSGYGTRGIFNGQQELLTAPVIIYQVMGRKAGWLAQAAAFARVDPRGEMIEGKAPHIILSNETLFNVDNYLSALDSTISSLGQAVVVVQEDLTDEATNQSLSKLYSNAKTDDFGNVQFGRSDSFSTAIYLAQLATDKLKLRQGCTIKDITKVKEAAIVPQHIQRSCAMSLPDASEAYSIGYSAVEALVNGNTKVSVILKRNQHGGFGTGLTDLANIAGKEERVPLRYINGLLGPNQEFVNEYICTIGGPVAIPHYSDLQFKSVVVK